MDPFPPVPVVYSTPSAGALAAHLAAEYALDGPVRCTLLNRGFNDVYRVDAGEARFILRVSGDRARGPADVANETAFLAFLRAAGLPVAAALPTRAGALWAVLRLPQGPRAAVLFEHAPGRPPDLDSPEDARLQAVTLARIHANAAGFPGREAGAFRLDLAHLLHRPLAAVLALGLDAGPAADQLAAVAGRLADRVAGLDAGLSRIRCHGDCHGVNARIATEGPWAGQAVFFDFDDGGYGYRAYDVAVHLWAQLSFGRRRHAIWRAFHAGYEAVLPLTAADEAALPVFAAIRHIWLMGEFAGRTAEWGREFLTEAWLRREAAFLLDWERDRLALGLL